MIRTGIQVLPAGIADTVSADHVNSSPDLTLNTNLKHRWMLAGLLSTLVIVLALPAYYLMSVKPDPMLPDGLTQPPSFVGRDACISCHKTEYDQWRNSDHDRAMAPATVDTVLGDFNNVLFEHGGVISRFFKRDNNFYVNTRGPDGEKADFQITYTFGATPLQQYLVSFPGGRLQCLTIAWNVEKRRWYALPNHTNDDSDWLHWTNGAQNWNGMCAECHSTHLRKGYDLTTDTFNTTWSEIDVSCEACHGPGSHHVAWAEKPDMAREKTDNYNLIVKTRDITPGAQLAICARCHSRRALFTDFSHDVDNMMDYMIPSLLTENLYYPDGQILDEVYVYGSFTQSKMYQRNVKCSDCHNVHSLKLKANGNALCLQCHRKDVYDTKDHHFHKPEYKGKPSKGDDCISCHMPQSPYMGIDHRADHSIRIPRPDISRKYPVPNSCNTAGCHDDKTVKWSAEWTAKWYGLRERPHYVTVFASARNGDPEAHKALIQLAEDQLQPPVVRATAVSLLRGFPDDSSYKLLISSLSDDQALIRHTAISTLSLYSRPLETEKIAPLLYDPVKAVRMQAAMSLAGVCPDSVSAAQRIKLKAALDEYRNAMEYSADFPAGRYNLGNLYDALRNTGQAIKNYKEAIRIDRQFIPALNNLAMLYNRTGNNDEALKLFQEIIEIRPDLFDAAYSLGLLLAEEKRYTEAVIYLKKAAGGMPGRPRVYYNLGLLQQMLKQHSEAEASLFRALELDPENYDYLLSVADFLIRRKRYDEAIEVARKMSELFPERTTGVRILEYIHRVKKDEG
nr:tetratricopeptide repeat protein [uncultured Desulfobacter sp.]